MNIDNKSLPELLAPAGSPEALAAAVKGGADAIYLGGKIGNARMNAKNFGEQELEQSINYAHDNGRKIFITLNALHTDREILGNKSTATTELSLLNFVEFLIIRKADAFIVQDAGVAAVIKKYFPNVELHASTQMAGHGTDAARILHRFGFSRMVVARELSFFDLKELISLSPIETEIFIHGALCTSYSGRCFMSFVMGGGRSANRGSCAQPCRLPFNNGYPLSLKDLCLAQCFEKVLELSPKSIKIEGRMKSADYVYGVTKIYRTLLDERRSATKKEILILENLFSREGFTDGYFNGKIGKSMYGIRTRENIKKSGNISSAQFFSFSTDGKSNTKSTEVCNDKSEETPHFPHNLTSSFFGNNVMFNKHCKVKDKIFKYRLIFRKISMLESCLSFLTKKDIIENTERIFIPTEEPEFKNKFQNLPQVIREKTGILSPYVILDTERKKVHRNITSIVEKCKIKDILTDNLGHIELLSEIKNLNIHTNTGLNITNSFFLESIKNSGISSSVLSVELKFPQIRDIAKNFNNEYCFYSVGAYIYGRIPLMITENCLISNSGLCKSGNNKNKLNCPVFELKDRKGELFPIVATDVHRNMILNSVPIYLADKSEIFKELNLSFGVLNFTVESSAEIKKILSDYYYGTNKVFQKKFTRLYNNK